VCHSTRGRRRCNIDRMHPAQGVVVLHIVHLERACLALQLMQDVVGYCK
jgi:hypothetical protein